MKIQHNLVIRIALWACLALIASGGKAEADSARETAPLLGGEFFDISKSASAFVYTGDGLCSGLLVGAREILTAAHCVTSNIPNAEYVVIVGNKAHAVAARWYPKGYYDVAEYTPENGRYDIGLIELTEDVTNVKPTPVLYDAPLSRGEVGFVVGFGLNELEDQGAIPDNSAKIGTLQISFLFDGLFGTTLADSNIATCSGDSGGPVIQYRHGYYAVVGVVSAGTTTNQGPVCVPANSSTSIFVDLQSKYSKAFLANFPAIQRVSGRLIYFNHQMGQLAVAMQKGSRVRSLQLARARAAALSKSVKKLSAYANAPRKPGVNSTIKLLNAAAKAPNLKAAVSAMKRANKRATQLAQMSLNQNTL